MEHGRGNEYMLERVLARNALIRLMTTFVWKCGTNNTNSIHS